MPADTTSERKATRKRAALLVSWIPSTSTFRPHVRRRRNKAAKPSRDPLKRNVFNRNDSLVGLGNRTNIFENRQLKDLERNKSLDRALRRAAITSTKTNELAPGFGPSVICYVGPKVDAPIPGMITDQH